jgi:hypothetical protein
MWRKFNETMLKHEFPKLDLKGFMADNTQANWNAIKIVYGSGDTYVRMIDKECTCLFLWTQSFDKHTKQLIKPELQDEHKVLCHQYKNATSLGDVESHYALICCWWLSYGAASKASVHELNN